MSDDSEVIEFPLRQANLLSRLAPGNDKDGDEDACCAYGFLRGLNERGLAIEFRFRDGNCLGYPYNLLASWRYNPSSGVLLKYTGDVTTLVLIRGSNLDLLVNQTVNLTDRGLARYRITFVREMSEEELRKVGAAGPTIDRILVGECESLAEQRDWVRAHAPAFVRGEG
jgi:hypothetical protein